MKRLEIIMQDYLEFLFTMPDDYRQQLMDGMFHAVVFIYEDMSLEEREEMWESKKLSENQIKRLKAFSKRKKREMQEAIDRMAIYGEEKSSPI